MKLVNTEFPYNDQVFCKSYHVISDFFGVSLHKKVVSIRSGTLQSRTLQSQLELVKCFIHSATPGMKFIDILHEYRMFQNVLYKL